MLLSATVAWLERLIWLVMPAEAQGHIYHFWLYLCWKLSGQVSTLEVRVLIFSTGSEAEDEGLSSGDLSIGEQSFHFLKQ